MRITLLIALPAALSACGPQTEIITTSDRDLFCFTKAQLENETPGVTITRTPDGGVVAVTREQGFVSDVDPSSVYVECMAADPTGRTSLSAAAPVTFTPAEQLIWDGLTDAQRRDALAFIQDGGRLADFAPS